MTFETGDFYVWCIAAGADSAFIALREGNFLEAAFRDHDGWSTEVIDPTELAVGPSCAERDGVFAVAYAGIDHFLRVATRRDGAWEPRGILEVPEVWSPSLAIDAEGELHVSHVALRSNGISDVRYVWSRGPLWETTLLATGPYVSEHSAVAVEPAGRFHVVFGSATPDGTRLELRHVLGIGDDWSSTVIDEPQDFSPLGIALGPGGAPHVATWRYFGGLLHSTPREGRWHVEDVDTAGSWGDTQPLGVDARGNVHVAYSYSEQGGLDPEVRYATNESGEWRTETVELTATFTGLALDPLGRAHVAFLASVGDTYELRHAWREAEPCAP